MRVRRRSTPLRRRVWPVCAWIALVVLAVPAALGAAAGPLMRDLGATMTEHVCKCGMPAGKCGCPVCARLELERARERRASPVPLLERHCGDDARLLPSGALPNTVLAATNTALMPIGSGESLAIRAYPVPLARAADEPPTPPPRTASV